MQSRGALARIVRNAASMLVGDAAAEVLNFSSMTLSALALGPAGFGQLAEAQAFMDPFDSLAGLGLASTAMVVAARRGGVDGVFQGTALGLRTTSGLIAGALGVAVALVTGREQLFPLLAIIAVNMVVVPVSVVSALPFRYEQALHRRIAVPFFGSVVRFAGAYAAYRIMRRPAAFQAAILVATFAICALDYRLARRSYPGRPRFDRTLAKELLALGWPAMVFEVATMVYSRAPFFFLHGLGEGAEGQYGAADRLVRPLLSIASALFVSSLPTIATLATARKFEQMLSTYRTAIARILAFSAPVAAVTWFLASFLLRRFAPAYADAVWPFRVLLLGTFFMFLNMLSTAFVLALGKFRAIMAVVLADLVVYLLLASRLVPRYGALGAAISTSVMESINTLMQVSLVFYLLRRVMQDRASEQGVQ